MLKLVGPTNATLPSITRLTSCFMHVEFQYTNTHTYIHSRRGIEMELFIPHWGIFHSEWTIPIVGHFLLDSLLDC